MKTVIFYSSTYNGNTLKIAESIAATLSADLIAIETKISDFDLSQYDLIGIGSAIHFGQHAIRLQRFVSALPLQGKNIFIFSTRCRPFLGNYHRTLKNIIKQKKANLVDEFSCVGFDRTGPWVLINGYNKNRPNTNDLFKARLFAEKLQCKLHPLSSVITSSTVTESKQGIVFFREKQNKIANNKVVFLNISSCIQCSKCINVNKIAESMMVIASNMIHWNNMPEEWLKDKGMVDFMNKKGLEHDRLLENEIEKIFQQNKYPYCRNIESFRQKGKKQNININAPKVGEIDFIIVNKNKNKVFIADTKYNRARYDAVGYRIDYSNFIEYEKKLERKKNWLINNLQVLQEHLEEMFHIDYSILSFEVEAVFFINTPTFYMFNGKYKALTLLRIKEYIENTWDYPIIKLEDKTNKRILKYSHPYFKNPIIISTE